MEVAKHLHRVGEKQESNFFVHGDFHVCISVLQRLECPRGWMWHLVAATGGLIGRYNFFERTSALAPACECKMSCRESMASG